MILYGIKNCDTVKKAKKWLDSNQVSYQFHDFRVEGLNKETIQSWLTQIDIQQLLNKRSTTWKQLSEEEKSNANEDALIKLFIKYPTLIKRPVLSYHDKIFIGFSEQQYQQLLC